MISKTYCAIIVLIMFKSAICNKCNTWTNDFNEEATYHCYEQVKHRCEIELTKKDVTIHKPNKEKGTVDVEFAYEPNCKYEIELKRWAINDGTECKKNTPYRSPILHSKYFYNGTNVKDKVTPNCSKNATITLKYMDTGCYVILFTKESYNKNKDEFSKYLEQFSNLYFELPKRNLTFSKFPFKPTLQHRQSNFQTTFNLGHPFLKQHPNIYLEVECTKNCSKPSYGKYQLTPPSDNSKRTGKYDICYENNDTRIDFSCEVSESYDLECIFTNLLSGFYIFKYSMRHIIRCREWGACDGESKIFINNEREPLLSASTFESPTHISIIWIILGVVGVGFLLSIVCIIYANKRRREWKKKWEDLKVTYPEKEPPKNTKKVLLLYPNDIKEVMDTMEALRNVLKTEGLEVYDVYDEELQKSINEINEKWIHDRLSERDMKTIIIQTYCGEILSSSSHSALKLYRRPTCYDDYFSYALSLIRARKTSNNYRDLFIVDMGFDKMNFTEFSFYNPSVRYGLPHSLKELTRALLEKKSIDEKCVIDMNQSNKEIEEFIFKYQQMKNKIDDTDYLCKILKVKVLHINDKLKIEEKEKEIEA